MDAKLWKLINRFWCIPKEIGAMKSFKQYVTEADSKTRKPSPLTVLNAKLRTINKKTVPKGHARYQVDNDPDLDKIISHGQTFTELHRNTHFCTSKHDGRCHWNAAAEYKAGNADRIAIGYAHHPDTGWHQHSWGVKDGKVVEPTPHDRDNTHWHGRVLSKKESDAFATHVSKRENYPGAGNVRTTQGGSIEDLVKANKKA